VNFKPLRLRNFKLEEGKVHQFSKNAEQAILKTHSKVWQKLVFKAA